MSAAKVEAAPLSDHLYRCNDCLRVWRAEQLVNVGDIPGIFERVAPGEPMPAGECPKDGALCHEAPAIKRPFDGDYETLVVATRELLNCLNNDVQVGAATYEAIELIEPLVRVPT